MVQIVIEKSPVPIIWIDTSVITNITRARETPDKLDETQYKRATELNKNIKNLSRQGKIICPLAGQELEVWINRNAWLDTINDLGMGINCINKYSIQDSQLNSAMLAYAKNSNEINLSYLDIFFKDPVDELQTTLQQPFYITTRSDIIFGAEHQKSKKIDLLKSLNTQRERNVKNNISYSQQLKHEQLGDIEALVTSANNVVTDTSDSHDGRNDIYGYSKLMKQIETFSHYSGKRQDVKGLIKFYKSDYNKLTPYTNISARMFAKIMSDPQEIKTGDPMDIEHASSILPYVDLYITDKPWRTFINKERIGKLYNTDVCYIGDSNTITQFFDAI